MITDRNARANAYLFAAIVILEGLWGEKIRRPDVLEQPGEDGPRWSFAKITPKHPGWLSYSRILGACADLSALPDKDLKQRARDLFKTLFKTEYKSIKRLGRSSPRKR